MDFIKIGHISLINNFRRINSQRLCKSLNYAALWNYCSERELGIDSVFLLKSFKLSKHIIITSGVFGDEMKCVR